jgi:putative hemolysin
VSTGAQLGLVGLLILINAFLAGSEIALVSLREGQLQRLERGGRTGRLVVQLAREPNRFLATVQIGITLAGFLASATAALTLAEPLVDALDWLGRAARPTAVVVVTVILTFVTLVVGELAPKRVAMQRAERWSLMAARPLSGLARLTRPLVWLLGHATDLVVRLLGGDPRLGRAEVTEEEIRDLVATGGIYTREERRVITGTIEATDRVLRQVLRPRTVVLALPEGTASDVALDELVAAGHTRAPVYRSDLDDADRVVSVLDLVGKSGTVGEHAREVLALPESMALLDALRVLQASRQSLALVVSEYGGLEGIVTVEDLVEEIVGEIHDEYDRDVRDSVRLPDGGIMVVGHFPVHDLDDLGIDLPAGEYVTVAGLIHERLGRLAAPDDEVAVAGWRLRVIAMDGRAIGRVRLDRVVDRPGEREA